MRHKTKEAKRRMSKILIGILLTTIILFVILVSSQNSQDLHSEFTLLENELSNQGYSWLINHFTNKFINNDNLMLSIDNKTLT